MNPIIKMREGIGWLIFLCLCVFYIFYQLAGGNEYDKRREKKIAVG